MITATFDGAERQFNIDGRYVAYFEAAIGQSLYAILKAITEGQWTFRDIAAVISFAMHGPNEVERISATAFRQAAKYGMPMQPAHLAPRPDVVAVLEREGHGNFAELAANILTDAIFRDKAQADAA